MHRYQIKIEYDGTSFVGWQFQKNGLSVQEIIQQAIFQFSKEKITVTGSGRTDAGVHAVGQVAHFDLKKKIKTKSFLLGVNHYLRDHLVAILKIKKTKKTFHSRFDAKKRIYQYVIVNRRSPLTLQKNKAWHVKKKLNIKSMKKGGKILEGTHDFSTFRASSCNAKSPIKTLDKFSLKKKKDKLIFVFTSKSFLQNQVRSMVGCIKYLGEEKWSIESFKRNFEIAKRSKCAPPAPACGLYLLKVMY